MNRPVMEQEILNRYKELEKEPCTTALCGETYTGFSGEREEFICNRCFEMQELMEREPELLYERLEV